MARVRPRLSPAPRALVISRTRADAHRPGATAALVAVVVLTALATASKLAYLVSLHAMGADFWTRPF